MKPIVTISRKKKQNKRAFISSFILLIAIIGVLLANYLTQCCNKLVHNPQLNQTKSIPNLEVNSKSQFNYNTTNATTFIEQNSSLKYDDDKSTFNEETSNNSVNEVKDKDIKIIVSGPKVRRFFDNKVENILETLSRPGSRFAMAPAPLKLSQEEILGLLKQPIVINDEDDKNTIEAKERTANLKSEALQFVLAGGSFDDFVNQMVAISNQEADFCESVTLEKRRLIEEEGIEAAEAYLIEANKILRDAGLPEQRITLVDQLRVKKLTKRKELEIHE